MGDRVRARRVSDEDVAIRSREFLGYSGRLDDAGARPRSPPSPPSPRRPGDSGPGLGPDDGRRAAARRVRLARARAKEDEERRLRNGREQRERAHAARREMEAATRARAAKTLRAARQRADVERRERAELEARHHEFLASQTEAIRRNNAARRGERGRTAQPEGWTEQDENDLESGPARGIAAASSNNIRDVSAGPVMRKSSSALAGAPPPRKPAVPRVKRRGMRSSKVKPAGALRGGTLPPRKPPLPAVARIPGPPSSAVELHEDKVVGVHSQRAIDDEERRKIQAFMRRQKALRKEQEIEERQRREEEKRHRRAQLRELEQQQRLLASARAIEPRAASTGPNFARNGTSLDAAKALLPARTQRHRVTSPSRLSSAASSFASASPRQPRTGKVLKPRQDIMLDHEAFMMDFSARAPGPTPGVSVGAGIDAKADSASEQEMHQERAALNASLLASSAASSENDETGSSLGSGLGPAAMEAVRAAAQQVAKKMLVQAKSSLVAGTSRETDERIAQLNVAAAAVSARLDHLQLEEQIRGLGDTHALPGVDKLSTAPVSLSRDGGNNHDGPARDDSKNSEGGGSLYEDDEFAADDGDGDDDDRVQVLRAPSPAQAVGKMDALKMLEDDAKRIAAEMLQQAIARDPALQNARGGPARRNAPNEASATLAGMDRAGPVLSNLAAARIKATSKRRAAPVASALEKYVQKKSYGILDLYVARQQAGVLRSQQQEEQQQSAIGETDSKVSDGDHDALLLAARKAGSADDERAVATQASDERSRRESELKWDDELLQVPAEDERPLLLTTTATQASLEAKADREEKVHALTDDQEARDDESEDDELLPGDIAKTEDDALANGNEEEEEEEVEEEASPKSAPLPAKERMAPGASGATGVNTEKLRTLSPGTLRKRLLANVNLLESLEQTHQHLNELEHSQALSLAQHENAALMQQWDEERRQATEVARIAAVQQASTELVEARTAELEQHIREEAQAQIRAAETRASALQAAVEEAKRRESSVQTTEKLVHEVGSDAVAVEHRDVSVAARDPGPATSSQATSPIARRASQATSPIAPLSAAGIQRHIHPRHAASGSNLNEDIEDEVQSEDDDDDDKEEEEEAYNTEFSSSGVLERSSARLGARSEISEVPEDALIDESEAAGVSPGSALSVAEEVSARDEVDDDDGDDEARAVESAFSSSGAACEVYSSFEEDRADDDDDEEADEVLSSVAEEPDAESRTRNAEFLNVHLSLDDKRVMREVIPDESFLREEGMSDDERTAGSEAGAEGSFRVFTKQLLSNYRKDAAARRNHEQELLRMREKALREKTREQLKWLIHQKKLMVQWIHDKRKKQLQQQQQGGAKTLHRADGQTPPPAVAAGGSLGSPRSPRSPRARDISMPSQREIEASLEMERRKIETVFKMSKASIDSERAALNEAYYREELNYRKYKQSLSQLQQETAAYRQKQARLRAPLSSPERDAVFYKAASSLLKASSSPDSLGSPGLAQGVLRGLAADLLSPQGSRTSSPRRSHAGDAKEAQIEEEIEDAVSHGEAYEVDDDISVPTHDDTRSGRISAPAASASGYDEDSFEEEEEADEVADDDDDDDDVSKGVGEVESVDAASLSAVTRASGGSGGGEGEGEGEDASQRLAMRQSIELRQERISSLKTSLGDKMATLEKLREKHTLRKTQKGQRKVERDLEVEIERIDEEICALQQSLAQSSSSSSGAGYSTTFSSSAASPREPQSAGPDADDAVPVSDAWARMDSVQDDEDLDESAVALLEAASPQSASKSVRKEAQREEDSGKENHEEEEEDDEGLLLGTEQDEGEDPEVAGMIANLAADSFASVDEVGLGRVRAPSRVGLAQRESVGPVGVSEERGPTEAIAAARERQDLSISAAPIESGVSEEERAARSEENAARKAKLADEITAMLLPELIQQAVGAPGPVPERDGDPALAASESRDRLASPTPVPHLPAAGANEEAAASPVDERGVYGPGDPDAELHRREEGDHDVERGDGAPAAAREGAEVDASLALEEADFLGGVPIDGAEEESFYDWTTYNESYVRRLFELVEERGGVAMLTEWKQAAQIQGESAGEALDVSFYLDIEREDNNAEFLQINNKMVFDLVNSSLEEILLGSRVGQGADASAEGAGTSSSAAWAQVPFRQALRLRAPVPPMPTLVEEVLGSVLRWDRLESGPSVVPALLGHDDAQGGALARLGSGTDSSGTPFWTMDEYERMENVICSDLQERDEEWTRNEREEWDVISQVADLMLADLIKETAQYCDSMFTHSSAGGAGQREAS